MAKILRLEYRLNNSRYNRRDKNRTMKNANSLDRCFPLRNLIARHYGARRSQASAFRQCAVQKVLSHRFGPSRVWRLSRLRAIYLDKLTEFVRSKIAQKSFDPSRVQVLFASAWNRRFALVDRYCQWIEKKAGTARIRPRLKVKALTRRVYPPFYFFWKNVQE